MMHTLKELRTAILNKFKEHSTYLGVNAEDIANGKKDGSLPQSAPSIWVYAEPLKARQNEHSRAKELRGVLAIFAQAIGNVEQNTEADDEAIELCERAENIIYQFSEDFFILYISDSVVQLDGSYGNYSTAFIKFEFQYKSSAQ